MPEPNKDAEPNKGGRPRKELDLELVEKLAGIGCTREEIAYACGLSVDTLSRREGFAEAYKNGDAAGKRSLRHWQTQAASKGSVPMLIWLGKVRLGQQDTLTTQHTGEISLSDGARERLISKLSGAITAQPPVDGDQLVN